MFRLRLHSPLAVSALRAAAYILFSNPPSFIAIDVIKGFSRRNVDPQRSSRRLRYLGRPVAPAAGRHAPWSVAVPAPGADDAAAVVPDVPGGAGAAAASRGSVFTRSLCFWMWWLCQR